MSGFHFRPADTFVDRHGLFVALVGGTNSGKTFSALRLARGIAGPSGKIAVLDTEGGRTLHLKNAFRFDANVMDPPFRPERFSEAAASAEDAGYDVLLIDSFSMEWVGMGGVLDWQSEQLTAAVERQRGFAATKGWTFDENKAMNSQKMASWIAPKMAHKAMVYSFLQRRMPIIFAIRGEETFDADTKKTKFKSVCNQAFPFEVTVSFRLAADRKGIIDLSDPSGWKMEGAHREIFRDGDQLCEDHGAKLAEWACGGAAKPAEARNLDAEADTAAGQGMASYEAFFKGLSKDERARILPGHEARKKTAAACDSPPPEYDNDFGLPPVKSAVDKALADLRAAPNLEAFNAVIDAIDVDVCRQIGAEGLDRIRNKLI